MAGKFIQIETHIRSSENIQDIASQRGFTSLTVGDVSYLIARGNRALGNQKSKSQFGIVTRGAHGDGDALALDTDLQRFLNGEQI